MDTAASNLRAGSQEVSVDLLGRALGSLMEDPHRPSSPAHVALPGDRTAGARVPFAVSCSAAGDRRQLLTAGEPACCSVGTVGQSSDVVRCCPTQ